MSHPVTNPALHRRPVMVRRTPLAPVVDAIAACWTALVRQRAVRRDEHFLLSQPDYILRDIGIGRGEIEAAVRGRRR
ncbi:MAG TPA: hypothetical protein VHA35_06960 [Dongiaceae bacterium]|jgi:hypothetical protein|nr:hypothetical protein [Dongiaceae bacterium]